MSKRHVQYGYGIVDRFGKPWWEEGCVCQDRAPMIETLATLNGFQGFGSDADDRAPYRVVVLNYITSAKRRRKP